MAKASETKSGETADALGSVVAAPLTKYVVNITQFGPHVNGTVLYPGDLPDGTDFDRLLGLGILRVATVTVPA